MKKVLIVDDNEMILALLEGFLKGTYELERAMNGQDALEKINTNDLDLIILDICLPDISGFEILNEIRTSSQHHDVPVIFISSKQDDSSHVMAYKLGVDDYLTKPFTKDKLMAVIESKLKRLVTKPNQQFQNYKINNLRVDTKTSKAYIDDDMIRLTPKEFSLLKFLCASKGEFVSREDLLENIWPNNHNVTDRAIDNHISNLRKKMKNADIKILSEYKRGYMIQEMR